MMPDDYSGSLGIELILESHSTNNLCLDLTEWEILIGMEYAAFLTKGTNSFIRYTNIENVKPEIPVSCLPLWARDAILKHKLPEKIVRNIIEEDIASQGYA